MVVRKELSSLQPERCLSSRTTLIIRWWCQLVSLERTLLLHQESWDENQTSELLRTFCSFLVYLPINANKCLKKKCLSSDWVIKISEKMSFITIYCYHFLLFIFHFVLRLSLLCLPFFRSPSLEPLSRSFTSTEIIL